MTDTLTTLPASDETDELEGTITEFCDYRCMYARGPECDCKGCNGSNHGLLSGFYL